MSVEELKYYFWCRYSEEQKTVTVSLQGEEIFAPVLSALGVDTLVISEPDGFAFHEEEEEDEEEEEVRFFAVLEGEVELNGNLFKISLGMYLDEEEFYCTLKWPPRQEAWQERKMGELFLLGKELRRNHNLTFDHQDCSFANAPVHSLEFGYKPSFQVFYMIVQLDLVEESWGFWQQKGMWFSGFAVRMAAPQDSYFRVSSEIAYELEDEEAILFVTDDPEDPLAVGLIYLCLESGQYDEYSVDNILGEGRDTLSHVYDILGVGDSDTFIWRNHFWQEEEDGLCSDFYSDARTLTRHMLGELNPRCVEAFLGYGEDWFDSLIINAKTLLQEDIGFEYLDFSIHFSMIDLYRDDESREYAFGLLNADFSILLQDWDSLQTATYQGIIPHGAGDISEVGGTWTKHALNIEELDPNVGRLANLQPGAAWEMEIVPEYGQFVSEIQNPEEEPSLFLGQFDQDFNLLPLVPADAFYSAEPSLRVTDFIISGDYFQRSLSIEATVDTSAVLQYTIGRLQVTVKEISAFLNYNSHNTSIGISGILKLKLKTEYALSLDASYENKIWTFRARLSRGTISLTEIVEAVTGWSITGISLDIYRLEVLYRTDSSFFLALGIRQQIAIFDGQMNIAVEGEISQSAGKTRPAVLLKGQVDIQSFLFQAQIRIDSTGKQELALVLGFDRARLMGTYQDKVVRVVIENLTIGVLLKLLFQVWRPNVKFYLPKPWDVLNQVGFSRITLEFHVDSKDVSVTIAVDINLLAVRIKGVTFTYQKPPGEEQAKFMVSLDHEWLIGRKNAEGAFLREDFQDPIQPWDALNESSPAPLDQTAEKLFRLSYFGIGRYIDLNLEEGKDGKLSEILKEAKKSVTAVSEVPAGKFNASYGWFIGAQFTLLDCFEVSLLFYDPLLYGLEVAVTSNDPLPLKGLDLTIYYRKISEKIGVFYVHAVLPDLVRHMDFGALSIDLPDVEVWIYTNGNFKVNFGFPYERDFSGSFALSYGIFTGKGGFYFGYLCGDTSSQVPVSENGYFDPVIELGLGICVQVGKKLDAGILSLSASLELTGIFTGVFARFHYDITGEGESTCWYYKCTGYVAIAGEISGSVNFYIISVNFRICARASICLTLEDGEEGLAVFEASFSVSASIKILFIKFSFHFSFTWQAEFALGEKQDRPWKTGTLEQRQERVWVDGARGTTLESVSVRGILVPYFSVEDILADWGKEGAPQGEGAGGTKKIAFFLSLPKEEFTDLYVLLAERAIGFLGKSKTQEVTLEELEELLEELQDGTLDTSFTMEALTDCFDSCLSFTLAWENAGNEQENVPFPLPPVYGVEWQSFSAPSSQGQQDGPCGKEVYAPEDISGEEWFCSFILMVTKLCVDKAVQYRKGDVQEQTVAALLEYLRKEQKDNICAMVTRAMFGGSRVDGVPLYETLAQQFNGQEKQEAGEDFVAHKLLLDRRGEIPWVLTEKLEASLYNSQLDYPREPLEVRFLKKPAQPLYYRMADNVIALQDCQKVYLEDQESYFLWKPQGDISGLGTLQLEFWEQSRLAKQDARSAEGQGYLPVALLDIGLKRIGPDSHIYLVTGASAETRSLLASLEAADVEGVEVLWSKRTESSGEAKKKGAFYYREKENQKIYLVRRNLSQVTRAYEREANGENAADAPSVLARLEDSAPLFLALLTIVLQTGTEGHYLKVDDEPDSLLFDDEGETTLYLAVGLKDTRLAQRIRLDAPVEEGKVPVVVNPELGQKPLQSVAPGYLGYELTIQGDREDASPFHLLCTRLFGVDSAPASMQEDEEAQGEEGAVGFYYSSFLKLPPLGGEENPYERILPGDYQRGKIYAPSQAQLSLGFTDIAGNRTAEGQRYQAEDMPLLYYDNLHALTELPFCAVSYLVRQQGEGICLSVGIAVQKKETFKAEDAGVVKNMIQQISMADVVLKGAFLLAEEGTGTEYRMEGEWDAGTKQSLLSFLRQLGEYLEDTSGKDKPADFQGQLTLNKATLGNVDRITVLALRSEVTIERDRQFTDTSSKLPNVQSVCSALVPGAEDGAFAEEFEKIYSNAKLVKKDGLYAVFFPEGALDIQPVLKKNIFYSVRPLSTQLESREGIAVTDLWGKQVLTDYYEIDLEKWAAAFFAFYEQLLSPENLDILLSGEHIGEAAAQVKALLELKEILCGKIVSRMESLFTPGEQNGVAREALQDALRKNLSKGYLAAGTAVYKTSGKMGDYALDGQLEGPVGVLGAKVTKEAQLGFVAAPAVTGAQSEISMEDAVYTFTHLEDTGSGEWYRFVRSFRQFGRYIQVNLGRYGENDPVKIPVPQRQYPDVPVLSLQQTSAEQKLQRHPAWDYTFTMTAAFMAQDALYLDIRTSQMLEDALKNREGGDLMDALANFIYNRADYEKVLFGEEEDGRSRALAHFVSVARSVGDAWPVPTEGREAKREWVLLPKFEKGRLSCLYAGQRPEFLKSAPKLMLALEDGTREEAVYDGENACYRIPEKVKIEPGAKQDYIFTCQDIPLYEYQGMWAEVYLKRNARFLGMDVNPAFVYTTSKSGFNSPAYPFIRMSDTTIEPYSKDKVEGLLKIFLPEKGKATALKTEITLYFGQRLRAGIIAARPAKKLAPHRMTQDTVSQVLDFLEEGIEKKLSPGQGLVKVAVRQYIALEQGGNTDAGGYIKLVELEGKTYEV